MSQIRVILGFRHCGLDENVNGGYLKEKRNAAPLSKAPNAKCNIDT